MDRSDTCNVRGITSIARRKEGIEDWFVSGERFLPIVAKVRMLDDIVAKSTLSNS